MHRSEDLMMFKQELNSAAQRIRQSLKQLDVPVPEQIEWMPTPFEGQWGFGTNACFQAAAEEARAGKKVNVPSRAQEIAETVLNDLDPIAGFVRTEAESGYLNLYIEPAEYANRVIDTVLENGERFGSGDPKKLRVMVEYSQPNTHKAFHVGHLRNVILGGAMSNILEFAGYDTVRANYIGDIGWHVIQWLWCYLKFHAGEEPKGDRTRWMQDIYTEARQLVENNPKYEAEAREVFTRWESDDAELKNLWKKTRQWSLEGFNEIYEILGEHFDVFFYESEVEKPGKILVEELIEQELAVDERSTGGPVVVKLDELLGLEKETYRVLVILRSDGTSLYATKDIPLAIKKFEEWQIDKSIYVIDVRQSLYLKQIYKLLEIMGFKQGADCYHLSYEIVNLPGDVTISSREGTIVMFDDLVQEAFKRALWIVEDKNPSLSVSQKKDVAEMVALGALKYPMLAVDNNKVATFDWERALDFEGQAAPYIQYAHVRANSILNKAGTIPHPVPSDYELEVQEISLLDHISRFPDEVSRSAENYKPLTIANYAYDLAKAFSEFYQHCPVLKAEKDIRALRLRLTAVTKQTLANSLHLLGIKSPEVM
jgi:arginyl-tRNA synthetase